MMRTSFECVLRFCFTLDVINHILLRESADVSGKTEYPLIERSGLLALRLF